jgi:hypothetical protein
MADNLWTIISTRPLTGEDRRRALVEKFEGWLDLLDYYAEAATDHRRARTAAHILREGAHLIAAAAGDEIGSAAYGPPPHDKREALERVAARLAVAKAIFGGNVAFDDGASLSQVQEEARVVAAGDVPAIFARIGDRTIKIRSAVLKLRALEWNAYLTGRGIAGYERHAEIGLAFGHDWETISKWRSREIIPKLGQQHFDAMINLARQSGSSGFFFWGMRQGDEWRPALHADGARSRHGEREDGQMSPVSNDDAA